MIQFDINNLDAKQREIFDLLQRLVSEGSALMYYDAAQLLGRPNQFVSSSHLIGHLYREIGGTILDVWSHKVSGTDAQKKRIRNLLNDIELLGNDNLINIWVDAELHSEAHRLGLRYPRIVNHSTIKKYKDLDATWITILTALSKSNFLKEKYLKIEEFHLLSDPDEAAVVYIDNNFPYSQIFFRELFEPSKNLSAEWFPLLHRQDFFKYPHEPMVLHDGSIYHSPWYQIQYLRSVARVYPTEVYDIMMEIADTENENIQLGIGDVALQLPPIKSEALAKKVIGSFMKKGRLTYALGEKYIDWIEYLSKNNCEATALRLARELLLFPASVSDDPQYFQGEPTPKLEWWAYESIIDKLKDKITPIFGIELFADILYSALEQETPSKKYGNIDYSYLWRPAIESTTKEHPIRSIDKIVDMLLEYLQLYLKESPERLETIIAMCSKYDKSAFRRIQLYLIVQEDNLQESIKNQFLLNEAVIRDEGAQTEYFKLLKKFMPALTDKEKEYALNTNFKEDLGGVTDRSEAANESWKLKRLHFIKEQLPDKWREEHDNLLTIYGEPEEFGSDSIYRIRSGYLSPVSAEELKAMSVENIVAYLNLRDMPTPTSILSENEGLSRTLTTAVVGNISKFTIGIEAILGINDPTYLRGIISGFDEAVEKGLPVENLNATILLCQHIAALEYRFSEEERFYDDNISGAKKAVIWYLSKLTKKNTIAVSDTIVVDILNNLLLLSEDADPVNDKYPLEDGDYPYSNLGLNSVRSAALRAAIDFASWLKQNNEAIALPLIAKVLEALEKHLDPSLDASPIVRQIYGSSLGALCYLNYDWVENHIDDIFPSSDEYKHQFQQAWRDFLSYGRANYRLFPKLRGHYLFSILDPSVIANRRREHPRPMHSLAEHLMQYYIWGLIELDDPLITEFYSRADQETITHAMKLLRPSDYDEAEEESNELVKRVRAFWEYRLAEAKAGISEKEIASFGWWFVKGKPENVWKLQQLKKALLFSGKIEASYHVLKQLALLSSEHAESALECLELMFRGERNIIAFQEEEVRKILATASGHSDDLKRMAMEFTITIVAKEGFRQYADLLKSNAQ